MRGCSAVKDKVGLVPLFQLFRENSQRPILLYLLSFQVADYRSTQLSRAFS
jgi:hypothetical protein